MNRAEIEFSMGLKTGGLIVAGALAVTGAVLLIYGAPRVPRPVEVSLWVDGDRGGLIVAGHF